MLMSVDPTFQMWATLAIAAVVVVLFITEWLPLELTAIGLLGALLILFQAFPVENAQGESLLDPAALLSGFGNPALITVLALLVVGDGLARTGILERAAEMVAGTALPGWLSVVLSLIAVLLLSAFLNNTPIVLIFIPIMQSLAVRLDISPSRLMMPLSFAAILGGMTTLIGSSTNLLVSGVLVGLGGEAFGFFEFTPIAAVLALVGVIYLILALPPLLPERASLAARFRGAGKQFISQAVVPRDSSLVGQTAAAGMFKGLPDITVRMIQRGERAELPPFEEFEVQPGDLLVLAGTRKALTEAAARHPGLLHPPQQGGADSGRERQRQTSGLPREGREPPRDEKAPFDPADQVLAEAMVSPSSRLVGMTLQQVGFRHRYHAVVLGVQRRARMFRGRMTDIRLDAGDVLLMQGRAEDIEALRLDRDLVLMSGSAGELPKPHHAFASVAIFLAAVLLAATGVLPIVVTAVIAAALMIGIGVMNIRQAVRALDRRIVLLVASALALGQALQVTGAAGFLAGLILEGVGPFGLLPIMGVYFLLVALSTNFLTNNACAVLFTPIGISLAAGLGVEPHIFAIATLLAANCSFASPIGYQTNLMVMGPGHYQFVDYLRVGLPLTLLLTIVFVVIAPFFFDLSVAVLPAD